MTLSAVAFLLPSAALAAGPTPVVARGPLCEPEPAVAEVFAELGQIDETCTDRPACREARRRRIDEGLKEHPDDFFLHKASQDLVLRWRDAPAKDRAALERSYATRLEERADDPLWLFLYARSLPGARDGERLEIFTRVLALDPTFAPAHFELAWLRKASPTHKAEAEALVHAEAYARLCPDALDLLRLQADAAGREETARRARSVLERRNDGRELGRYPRVWSLEFQSSPPGEHDAVRARIRADLERLEAWRLEERPLWWTVLAEGYGLIGDVQRKEELEGERLERFPCVVDAGGARHERFAKAHPYPTTPDPVAMEARSRALYAASAEWVSRCPESLEDWMRRFGAAEDLDDLPNEELGTVADRFLELWSRPDRGMSSTPSPYLRVAQAYLKRGFRLDRVDGLAGQGLLETEALVAEREGSPMTEEHRQRLEELRQMTLWDARTCQAEAAIRLGRVDEAAPAIEELERIARDSGSAAVGRDRPRQLAFLHSLRAEAEGRKLDALVLALGALVEEERGGKVKAQVDRLFEELGGTDEGRAALSRLERPEPQAPQEVDAPSGWVVKDTPLAGFELADLSGKRWTNADLEGRTVLFNVWRTTCHACVLELPHLQEVHERLRDRPDLTVISLNVDHNPGVVQPFVAERGYRFPVLLAVDWIEKTLGSGYVFPQSWIVDPDGVVRFEALGFDSAEADRWVDDVISRLTAVAEKGPAQ